ncbi:MAG TPA: carboxypeptidase-like regulatory domain-containing protein [Planctomycetota bacterium]|nr:carboxypeptidase-like regulatory domain-containing protein [Planctomycetota bacterium]
MDNRIKAVAIFLVLSVLAGAGSLLVQTESTDLAARLGDNEPFPVEEHQPAPPAPTRGPSVEVAPLPVEPKPRTDAIRGRVTNTEGMPVAAARIRADQHPRLPAEETTPASNPETFSDSEGWFELPVEGELTYAVAARKPGYASDISLGAKGGDRVNLVLDATGSLLVRVTADSSGELLSAATASLTTKDGFSVSEGTTDASGTALLEDIPAGTLIAAVDHPEFASVLPEEVKIHPGQVTHLEMVLLPGRTVRGVVQSIRENLPIADATVKAGARIAITDAAGAYELKGLSQDAVTVTASAPGYRVSTTSINLKGTRASAIRNFTLLRGARIEGTLVNETGDAVEGASMRLLMSWDQSLSDYWPVQHADRGPVVTDEQGRFAFDGCAVEDWGHLRISASHADHGDALSDVIPMAKPETLTVVALTIYMQGMINGEVKDQDGKAVISAAVELKRTDSVAGRKREYELRTDGAGAFSFEGLAEGYYYLKVTKEGCSTVVRHNLHVRRGAVVPLVAVVMEVGMEVRCRAKDNAGNPVQGARITVRSPKGAQSQGTTDVDGLAVITDAPSGPYTVSANAEGFSSADLRKVSPGEDGEIAVTMIRYGSLQGRVVDALSGEPITSFGLVITYAPADNGRPRRGRWSHNLKSDDGTFRLPMPDGDFLITASASGYETLVSTKITHAAASPADDIALSLTPACFLEGYIRNTNGHPFPGAAIYYRPSFDLEPGFRSGTPTEADGYFYIAGLRPGPVDLIIDSRGVYPLKVIEQQVVSPDRRNWMEETLDSAATIRLKWVFPDGHKPGNRNRSRVRYTIRALDDRAALSLQQTSSRLPGVTLFLPSPRRSLQDTVSTRTGQLSWLPPGEYEITAEWSGRKSTTRVDVVTGADQEIEIPLPSSAGQPLNTK